MKNVKRLSPLARHRFARGLTQTQLAALMNTKPSTVQGWEAGRFKPSPERMANLANHLGTTPLKLAEVIDEGLKGLDAR